MEWQPIETAPKDGTPVITNGGDGYKLPKVMQSVYDAGWWPDSWESPLEEAMNPTHWMPLPASTKEQS